MATTIIKDYQDDNQAKVDSTGHVYVTDGGTPIAVTGTFTATNPSVGPTGAPAPAQATEIAGVDSAGNLIPVLVTSTGQVEVTGTLTVGEGFSTISPGYPTQVSVGTVSTQLFASNANRKYAHIFNNSGEPIYIQYQVSAALNQGIRINGGSFFTLDSNNLWLGIINAIGVMTGQLIDVLEGE